MAHGALHRVLSTQYKAFVVEDRALFDYHHAIHHSSYSGGPTALDKGLFPQNTGLFWQNSGLFWQNSELFLIDNMLIERIPTPVGGFFFGLFQRIPVESTPPEKQGSFFRGGALASGLSCGNHPKREPSPRGGVCFDLRGEVE